MRIKLMSMLWLLGCAAAASPSASSSASPTSSPSSSSVTATAGATVGATPAKLKRDAGLSYGSGLYHGPSHKYLPPGPSSSSHGHGYDYALGLGSSNAYDFGHHLDTVSYQQSRPHYPHHHHHHQQQQQQQQHHHSLPHHQKVETYIVQTSGNNGGSIGGGGSSSSISHGSYAGYSHGHGHGSGHGQGYKYAAPQSGGGSYIHVLSSGHKLPGSGTYLLATPTADYYAASHQGYHRPTSYSTPGRLNLGHSSGLEHQLAAIAGAGIGSGVDEHHSSSSSSPSSSSGYSYEAPSIPFGKIPSLTTSYGVPLLPGYEHQPSHYEESLPEQDLDAESPNHSLHTEQHQTPAYALGHKGLGHFTYTASKPHALNTDIHSYAHPQQHPLPLGLSHHQELSKAPFKPSAFLGAKHEGSVSSSNGISGYDYATPTSLGYDYSQPQAPLYGAPGQSGDSATPIFEPEATYLPPATPTHGYH